jgi:hypothetical protein
VDHLALVTGSIHAAMRASMALTHRWTAMAYELPAR